MTELIVALDGPDPMQLVNRLWHEAGCRWFKLGPQTLINGASDWGNLISLGSTFIRQHNRVNVFLDLKLADTRETCREAVRRFANAGIAAVSTFTDAATEAAAEGAASSPLKVWRLIHLTDDLSVRSEYKPVAVSAGIIVTPLLIPSGARDAMAGKDIVTPGVRLRGGDAALWHGHGHKHVTFAEACAALGVTHAVVGRPIWQAADPIAAARAYMEVLSG